MKLRTLVMLLGVTACSSTPMYEGIQTVAELDRQATRCQNGSCSYELAHAYMRLGEQRKAWDYVRLSARFGHQPARTALINAGLPVPSADLAGGGVGLCQQVAGTGTTMCF